MMRKVKRNAEREKKCFTQLGFSLDGPHLAAMNLTDFRDNALLKLQVGGPFTGGMVDLTNQEYILIQVEQTEQAGQRRRRTQQVRASLL